MDGQESSRYPSKQTAKESSKNGQHNSDSCMKKSVLSPEIKEELKSLVKLASGTSLSSFFAFFIPLSTVLIVGHKGKVYLAAIGLGISVCNLTGACFVIGLTSVTETLCSQAYGAKDFKRFGVVIQKSIVITFLCILPSCALWINIEKILVLLGQDKMVSQLAGSFAVSYIPGLMLFILFNVLVRFLACQGITYPVVFGTLLAFVANGLFCYLFVHVCDFGVRGAAVALDLSYVLFCFFVLFVIHLNKLHQSTWHGWSRECFLEWKEYIHLAFPATIMSMMESFVYEIGIIVLGAVGSTEQAAAIAVYNLTGPTYFLLLGVSTGTAVRVGTFLGAGHSEMAKVTIKASLLVSMAITVLNGIAIIAAKDVIGYLFSNDREVAQLVSGVVVILAVHQIIDGFLVILMGAARGIGYQKYAATINIIGYWLIAIPLFLVLIFKAHLGVLAVRIGMLVNACCQTMVLSLLLLKSNWVARSNLASMDCSVARGSSYQEECKLNDEGESKYLVSDNESERTPKDGLAKDNLELGFCKKVFFSFLLFLLVVASLLIKVYY